MVPANDTILRRASRLPRSDRIPGEREGDAEELDRQIERC